MSEAGDAVLRKVRDAIGWTRDPAEREEARERELAAIPRRFRVASNLNAEELLSLFETRLAHYEAKAIRTQEQNLQRTIAEVLKGRGKHRLIVPPAVPAAWIPEDIEAVRDWGLDNQALDKSEGVLTGCAVAIALSGTIVLQSAEGQGRRAATLLPDYYLCVVRQKDVVEILPEAIKRLDARKTVPMTFVSGPSATVDIEMIRVKGVHGPRTLDIVIVLEG